MAEEPKMTSSGGIINFHEQVHQAPQTAHVPSTGDLARSAHSEPSSTLALAEYVAELRFEHLPEHIVSATRLLILDNVGCALGGARLGPARLLRAYLEELGGHEISTVVGGHRRLPAPHAGYANSYTACLKSFDDSHTVYGHVGTATIPGAIAVAEQLDRSGRDLITSIVAGYEVALRIGIAIKPSPARAKEVFGFATWQIFGALAAAARLHGFDKLRVADAFGLAVPAAPVPFLAKFHSRPMGWLKNNYGWSTLAALTAASLASRGFVGNRTVLDGANGFWVMAGSDRCDFSEMTKGLSEEYRLLQVGFKPYGCCQLAHTALDVFRNLAVDHSLSFSDVVRIDVQVADDLVSGLVGPWPTNFLEAQFHLPFLLALELLGRSSSRGIQDQDLEHPVIRECADRVQVGALPGASEKFHLQFLLPARVAITLLNGQRVEAEADLPTGAPGGPTFDKSRVIDKFMMLAEPIIGAMAATNLCERILSLDVEPVAAVMSEAISTDGA